MKKYIFFALISLVTCDVFASDFDVALNTVRTNCSGISEELSELKKMAGINTAITGVGTAAATGATVVGIVKTTVDKDLWTILRKVDRSTGHAVNPPASAVDAVYSKYIQTGDTTGAVKKRIEDESKTLGHWRTGLLGGSAATNVAGAIIANKNKVNEDLQLHIDDCIKSVDNLKNAIGQARMDGVNVAKANKIVRECGNWKYADLSVINNRSKGAFISSVVGAATGVAGTVTSAVANTDKVREGDIDKQKNLNTASNVLAGGTAVASGVATVFNATQISAVKKIIEVADNCEEVLK